MPNNAATNEQLRSFLQQAVENARNPDKKEVIRRERQLRAKKLEKKFGL